MDPNLSSILVILAGGGLVNVILNFLRERRRQPLTDAHDTVTLQHDVIQAFREGNTLHIEDTKTIREQAATITALTQANASLLDKIDGLPKRVAELMAQALVQEGFIQEQAKALILAGVSETDQPVQPPEIPLTKLTPETLLSDLAAEKAGETRIEGTVVLTPTDKPAETKDKPK